MMRIGTRAVSIRRVRIRFFLASLLAMLSTGCGDDSGDPPMCVEVDPTNCIAAYDPTWDNVYKFVVSKSCATEGVACHGRDGKKGNLGMFTQIDAYQGLVDGVGGKPRVIKGDAACSMLTERIETDDMDRRMPFLGDKLSASDRCAIEKWIAAGAPQ
jgi:hypothetical protein